MIIKGCQVCNIAKLYIGDMSRKEIGDVCGECISKEFDQVGIVVMELERIHKELNHLEGWIKWNNFEWIEIDPCKDSGEFVCCYLDCPECDKLRENIR